MIMQPNLTPVPSRNQYCLLDDYACEYDGVKIVVPEYFLFDGASIPWFGWFSTFTPFHPDVMAAAIIHDWLFVNHQVDFDTANQIFYDRLIENGTNKTKSKLMYKAVCLGAKKYWTPGVEKIDALTLLHSLIKTNDQFEDYHFPIELLK